MEAEFRNVNTVTAEGKHEEERLPPVRRSKFVSPGLFKTQGTPIIAGRDFTWSEIYDGQHVAVISENMARETWGGSSAALGKRIRVGTAAPWYQIIGVVGDVYEDGVYQKAPGCVYWPAGTRSVVFMVRSDQAGKENFLRQIREALWAVNANLPLAQVRTLGDVYNESMARTSFTLVMLAIAGAMALVLGIIGIYGVLSYAVSQRRREIAIRLALGAHPGDLKRMFVRQGLALAGIGLAIGLIAASGLTRLMSSLLFGTKPLDLMTYATAALLLGIAAVLASYLPARRASAVDPVETLRAE
jgi:predicted permease